jgi:hypothetical protein
MVELAGIEPASSPEPARPAADACETRANRRRLKPTDLNAPGRAGRAPRHNRTRIWAIAQPRPASAVRQPDTLAGMKQVEKWRWRIRWAGRSTTTRIHYTEAEIRREHPEAVRVDETRVLVAVPDTPQELERAQVQRRPSPG